MLPTKTGVWVVGISALVLWAVVAYAQDTRWGKENAAGVQALSQGRYAEAEQRFKAADVGEVEETGADRTRVARFFRSAPGCGRVRAEYDPTPMSLRPWSGR